MSVNKNRPHILVLPEDDANLQLANGFVLELPSRQIQRLPVAGGWREVLERFKSDHVTDMGKYPERLIVLLIDFDGRSNRLAAAKRAIRKDLIDRVFILGAWTEPEALKKAGLGSFETTGRSLAKDCRESTNATWGHARGTPSFSTIQTNSPAYASAFARSYPLDLN